MAGQQSRTVTLTLDAQTTGLDGVKSLASELGKLAKKGGEAAPEFERISKELSSVVEQQQAVTAFNELSAAVTGAKQSAEQARDALKTQRSELDTLKVSTNQVATAWDQAADQMRQARTEVQASNTNLLQARAAVTAYVSSIGGANSATREQTATLKGLKQAVLDAKDQLAQAKVAVSQLTPAYEQMKSAAGGAATEIKQQEAAIKSANAEVENAKAKYEGLEAELSVVSGALQKMGVNTSNVVGEQNRLQQALAKLSSEATNLKTKLDDPGRVAKTTGEQIETAFGVVGVRSVNAIKAEILKVNSALMTLANANNVSEDSFDRAFTSGKAKIKELEGELRKAQGTAKGFGSELTDAFKQFGPATLVFNGISAAISAFTSAASRIPQVTAEFQTMNRTLTILTGSTTAAAKEFEYIKTVANRVGSDIKGVGDAYIRLSAATKDTALAGAETKRIFEAVAGSMGVLGASSAETENALMAVTQMVSKGVVSMEEMRQQLGERLPGAFQVTAKELGITTSDLNDLISSGKMTAEQVLPALARGLESVYKSGQQNDTLIGKWRQFTNAMKESADAVGESGLLDSLLKVGRVGTALVTQLAEGFIYFGKVVGGVAAGIKSGNLREVIADLATEGENLTARTRKIAGANQEAAKSMGDLVREAKAAGQEFVTMADGTKIATAALDGANSGMVAFLVQSTKSEKQAESLATVNRKLAEYTRASGEAANASANALGDEIAKRQTATRVAQENAVALQNLLNAEKAVQAVLEERALKRVEEIAAKGQASDADQKMLDDLNKELIERKAVVDGLTAQTEANRVLSESLKLQADTLADNSTRVAELVLANQQYTDVLTVLNAEVAAGEATQQQINAVEEEARKIKRLLNDALDDQIKKTEAVKSAKLAELNVDQANIRLAIEVQKSIAANARARGDESTAARAGVEIKRLEIEMAKLTAKAKQAEAEASQLVAQAKIEELRTNGPMTAAKEAEIRALEASVKVKEIEAKIANETAKGLENLKWATLASGDAAATASGQYGGMVGPLNQVAGAADNAKKSLDALNKTPRGNGQGNGNPVSGDTRGTDPGIGASGSTVDNPNYDHGTFNDSGHQADRSVSSKDMLYKSGATIEEAALAEKYVGELMRRYAQANSGNIRSTEDNIRVIKDASEKAVQEAIRLARAEMAGATIDLGPSVAEIERRNLAQLSNQSFVGDGAFDAYRKAVAAAGQEAISKPAIVTINLNGKSQQVNMTSVGDANNLVDILKQLEADSARY